MNLDDAGFGSLRQAILDTPSGGTVDFEPGLSGTVTLMTGELLIGKDLTIAGPGADVMTVSGNNASRVFNIAPNYTVAISGLTIAGGFDTSSGGGIYNGGTLTVAGSAITGNAINGTGSVSGGGIANYGTLAITDSAVTGNAINGTGSVSGGGIANYGTLAITDSAVTGNASSFMTSATSFASGIFNAGMLAVSGTTVSGNSGAVGILNESPGLLTITNSTVSGHGDGGIYNNGTMTIASSTISENHTTGIGGGIVNNIGIAGGWLTVIDATISDNVSQGGGIYLGAGIANLSGPVTLIRSTISQNSMIATQTGVLNPAEGSGIFNSNGGTLTVIASTVSANVINDVSPISAGAYGGGISNEGSLTVLDSTLSGNAVANVSGSSNGGGIFNHDTGIVTVVGSTFNGNAAGTAGGGIYNIGVLTVRDTILAGNHAPSGPDLAGPLNSQGHNLIGDGTGGSGFADTDLIGTSAFPIDPMLEPLGDYGGPTQTMRPLPTSPVINAGDNTDAPETDQRGFPRIVLGFIDIGAVELQPDEFGGPAPHRVPTWLLLERVSAALTNEPMAYTASAANASGIPADRSALDVAFRFLGGQGSVADPQAALRPPLPGSRTGEPGVDPVFDGVAAQPDAF
jgi:hypothetical protein